MPRYPVCSEDLTDPLSCPERGGWGRVDDVCLLWFSEIRVRQRHRVACCGVCEGALCRRGFLKKEAGPRHLKLVTAVEYVFAV